jgi:large subunit ribosomal protein L21
MYAIVQQGGHQYRVAPGDRLLVDQLDAPVGTMVALQPVLLVQDDAGAQVGTPTVDGVRIAALVVSHRLGGKLRVFKYKAKKRYRRTHGHRSRLTELRVEALVAAGDPLPEPPDAAVTPGPEVVIPEEPAAKPARTRRAARPKAAVAEPPEAGTAEAAAVEEAVEESRAEAAEAEAEPVPPPKPAPRRGPRAARPKAPETSTEAPAPDTES